MKTRTEYKMTVKKKESNVPLDKRSRELILEAIDELIDQHGGEITDAIEEAEDRCLTVGIGLKFDCSESAPDIGVSLRFSTSVTDSRSIRCDDPNQPPLLLTPEEEAKLDARKKKEAEKAASKAKKDAKAAEKAAEGGKVVDV